MKYLLVLITAFNVLAQNSTNFFDPRCSINLELEKNKKVVKTYKLTAARPGWYGASTVTDLDTDEPVEINNYYPERIAESNQVWNSMWIHANYGLEYRVRLFQDIYFESRMYQYSLDLEGSSYGEFMDASNVRTITFFKTSDPEEIEPDDRGIFLSNKSTIRLDVSKIDNQSFRYKVLCDQN